MKDLAFETENDGNLRRIDKGKKEGQARQSLSPINVKTTLSVF